MFVLIKLKWKDVINSVIIFHDVLESAVYIKEDVFLIFNWKLCM